MEQMRLILVPLTDRFVGCLLTDPPVFPTEVIVDAPAPQIGEHLLWSGVEVSLGGLLLRQSIHPLGQAIGLGRVGLRPPVIDLLLLTEMVERMSRGDLGATPVLEARQCELPTVVREDDRDRKQVERKTAVQEVGGGFLVLLLVDVKEQQAGRPVHG